MASGINPEVEACIRKNAPNATTIEHIKLRSEGEMYNEEEFLTARIYWKHYPSGVSNLIATFEEPVDIYGSRVLFLEKKPQNEIYLYMPALSKVRRITSDRISSSMYGMDFSYEDFQWMYNMLSTAISEQRPDVVVNGEAMYVFAIIPREEKGSKYEMILSYFDKKSCVMRKVEFYEKVDELHKVLQVEPGAVKNVDGKLIPHKFLMRDVKNYSETELTVLSVKIDPPIPDSFFDPAQLKNNRDIK
jgi:outer membrane lipoprotein-sorting protein